MKNPFKSAKKKHGPEDQVVSAPKSVSVPLPLFGTVKNVQNRNRTNTRSYLERQNSEEHKLREKVRALSIDNSILEREVLSSSERLDIYESEAMLSSLLRDKLNAKELELEEIQIQLAAAVQENGILKSDLEDVVKWWHQLNAKERDLEEIQVKLDEAVRENGKLKIDFEEAVKWCYLFENRMKQLELELVKKEETEKQLRGGVEEMFDELKIIYRERTRLQEDVKHLADKNDKLTSEMIELRRRIEDLDEENSLLDGRYNILKGDI